MQIIQHKKPTNKTDAVFLWLPRYPYSYRLSCSRTAQLRYSELVDKGRAALFVWGTLSKLLIYDYNEFLGLNSRSLVVFAQFESQRM